MSGKHPTWYAFIRWLVKTAYFKTHGGIRSVGAENMPSQGGVIVAPLHISHLDPPAVACGTRRRLRFMAKEELFHHKLFGALITSLGSFPVRRGETDTESIRRAIALLEEGEAVLIFPEGTRGDGETIQELNRGVAMLAKRTNVPVVPVGIIGTNVVMPRGKTKRGRHLVTLAYGRPFTYAQLAVGKSERENRDIFAAELQKRIVDLCAENGLKLRIANSGLD
ncbi:MAG: lysophospholipid acyltransferase family protein [Fimbriimonas sp.]|nr:lysophospholipid acyltransferase family protein [Fimbriimonas sp.]